MPLHGLALLVQNLVTSTENEDPTAFFNHQDDSDEDVAPEPPPSQTLSPVRQRMSQNQLINPVKSGGSELTSPRATGEITAHELPSVQGYE